jgi:hypothetical protein
MHENGAMRKGKTHVKLSAPKPYLIRIPVTNCEIAHPVSTKFRKNPSRGRPISKTDTPKKGIASKAAGNIPMRVRIIEIVARAAISSRGRRGDTNKLPRLRDHNSSKKERV